VRVRISSRLLKNEGASVVEAALIVGLIVVEAVLIVGVIVVEIVLIVGLIVVEIDSLLSTSSLMEIFTSFIGISEFDGCVIEISSGFSSFIVISFTSLSNEGILDCQQ